MFSLGFVVNVSCGSSWTVSRFILLDLLASSEDFLSLQWQGTVGNTAGRGGRPDWVSLACGASKART